MNQTITDYERKKFEETINSNRLSPEDQAYFLNESMNRLGIPTADKDKTQECQKSYEEVRNQKVIDEKDMKFLLKPFTDKNSENIFIYTLFVKEHKLFPKEYLEDAVRHFENKQDYISAGDIQERLGEKALADKLYIKAVEQLKERNPIGALEAAVKTKLPSNRVEECFERAKTILKGDKEAMTKIFRIWTDYKSRAYFSKASQL